jgi:hypothetical protein
MRTTLLLFAASTLIGASCVLDWSDPEPAATSQPWTSTSSTSTGGPQGGSTADGGDSSGGSGGGGAAGGASSGSGGAGGGGHGHEDVCVGQQCSEHESCAMHCPDPNGEKHSCCIEQHCVLTPMECPI